MYRSPVCQQSPDTTVVTPRTSPDTGEAAAGGQEPAGGQEAAVGGQEGAGGQEAAAGGQVSPDTITCGDCGTVFTLHHILEFMAHKVMRVRYALLKNLEASIYSC